MESDWNKKCWQFLVYKKNVITMKEEDNTDFDYERHQNSENVHIDYKLKCTKNLHAMSSSSFVVNPSERNLMHGLLFHKEVSGPNNSVYPMNLNAWRPCMICQSWFMLFPGYWKTLNKIKVSKKRRKGLKLRNKSLNKNNNLNNNNKLSYNNKRTVKIWIPKILK